MAKLNQDSLKQRMESKGGGGDSLPIVRIKKDQPLLVRFLTEPTEWSTYDEYYDPEERKSYVVHPGQHAPAEVRLASRYLANVLLVDDDKVLALMMPQTLAQRVYARWTMSKKDTICDRDFELARMGEGLKTVYMEAPEAPHERPIAKYTLLDLEDVIARMNQAPGQPQVARHTSAEVEADTESIYDNDEADEAPAPRASSRRPAMKPGPGEEPFPPMEDEAFPEEKDDEEEEGYWSKEELLELSFESIVEMASEAGIKEPEKMSHVKLADLLGV